MKNIKKLLFTFFAIFTILGLTGCSNQESSLVINDDDTSTLTYVITLDKD